MPESKHSAHFEHLPAIDKVLMDHIDNLETLGRRDLASIETESRLEDEGYPDWTKDLKPKVNHLRLLLKKEDAARAA